jgi:hypothetical protein
VFEASDVKASFLSSYADSYQQVRLLCHIVDVSTAAVSTEVEDDLQTGVLACTCFTSSSRAPQTVEAMKQF